MRKLIKSPTPELSQLKQFNVDLDMTGAHYITLATSDNTNPEEIMLSILKDLVEEDANQLTLPEARYLFMLIKINSLENNYTATIRCKRINPKTNDVCDCENTFPIVLSDADLNCTPKGYKVPKIKLNVIKNDEQKEEEFSIIPPIISMEIVLKDWLLQQKGYSIECLDKNNEEFNAKAALEYTWLRSMLHLVNRNGERFVSEINDFENALKCMELNTYSTVSSLYKYAIEVDSFGVQPKDYEFTCKECGGKLTFRLPLFHGLVSKH